MSSLWDSRFTDDRGSKIVMSPAELERNDNLKISSILGAAGRRLPLIQPAQLSFHKHLGAGACFRVDCESYTRYAGDSSPRLVAVKHMQIGMPSDHRNRSLYDSVMREVRVLTHLPLKNHEYIIPALAYGWLQDSVTGTHPYLVVDYSDHGTLTDYLQRIRPPISERRELALDIALGLEALHNSEIIHGDVKASNVLVFDRIYSYNDASKPQIAKLADFGAAIFDVDFDEGPISYKGTARYNAPEQEGWAVKYNRNDLQTKEMFYKADVYSFGLLLWEIIKNGDDYIELEWQMAGELDLQFLERIFRTEEDGIMHRALTFCESLFSAEKEPTIHHAIIETFRATLRDNPDQRLDIRQLVDLVAEGTEKNRPKLVFPLSQHGLPPLDIMANGSVSSPPSKTTGIPSSAGNAQLTINLFERYGKSLFKSIRGNPSTVSTKTLSTISHQSSQTSPLESKGLASTVKMTSSVKDNAAAPFPYRVPSAFPDVFRRQELDLLQISATARLPPWETQCSIVDEIRQSAERYGTQTDDLARGEACLQLSICYHIGFGVELNVHEMFRYLREALRYSYVAQSIYVRVVAAIGTKTHEDNIQHGFFSDIDMELEPLNSKELYFSERFRKYQKHFSQTLIHKVWEVNHIKFTLQNLDFLSQILQANSLDHFCVSVEGPRKISSRTTVLELLAEVGAFSSIHEIILHRRCSDAELSRALNKACKYGHFNAAMLLANQCRVFVHDNNSEPTALHWLIMFDADECDRLARLLVLGSPGTTHESNGLCKTLINEIPPIGSEPTRFPMHCLQLSGSPLHWAVATRNLPLVKLLVELGANPIISQPESLSSEITSSDDDLSGLTPLQLATHYHLFEIVDFFLSQTDHVHNDKTLRSSFHYLGIHSIPFSRCIVHGSDYRNALKKTISLLISSRHDINEVNNLGETAFMAALAEPDTELYILEELLKNGARADNHALKTGKNAISIVASNVSRRRFQVDKFTLVLSSTSNLNDLDKFGYNALHYLALGNAGRAAELIFQDQRLKIDTRTSRRNHETAMHIAAKFGSVDVLRLLIQANAIIDVKDEDDKTPLEVAVLCRQKEATDILLAEEASPYFDISDNGPRSTVLHSAVSGPSYPGSIIRYLLENYIIFRSPLMMNMLDKYGWTPLHKATFYGDNEGVASLLSFGADHSVACTYPYPIAPGITSLDVVKNLVQGLHTESDLCYYHSRIKKGGPVVFKNFLSRLNEIRRLLEMKAAEGSELI